MSKTLLYVFKVEVYTAILNPLCIRIWRTIIAMNLISHTTPESSVVVYASCAIPFLEGAHLHFRVSFIAAGKSERWIQYIFIEYRT